MIGKRLQGPLKTDQNVPRAEGPLASSSSNLDVEGKFGMHDREKSLAKLLETTLVGLLHDTSPEIATSRQKDFVSFSQQASLMTGNSVGEASTTQSEVGCLRSLFRLDMT